MTDSGSVAPRPFQPRMEHFAAAFAVTRGAEHALVYANAAFRRLLGAAAATSLGHPLAHAFAGRDTALLTQVLDRAFLSGIATRDQTIEPLREGSPNWNCTVWPEVNQEGRTEHLFIELHETSAEPTLALLREVAERILLGALREHDAADTAEASSRRATYLATEGHRLAESLDERATLNAVSRLTLPRLSSWCIVDLIQSDMTARRLSIIHPDPAKQELLRTLQGRWSPEENDPFGAPAVLRNGGQSVVSDGGEATLTSSAHDPATLNVLREVGVGALLTTPLSIRGRLVGAVTFVSGRRDHDFTEQDIKLAEGLAIRSATALDSARLHSEALTLKTAAEAANRAKSAFLGTMSHELRTPLNAIGGYVDLIALGARGPVTDAQHIDLERIRTNLHHLVGLITDILNLVHLGSGRAQYDTTDVSVHPLLTTAVAMVEPLMLEKSITCEVIACEPAVAARADRERVAQILVNLLSNAIKFTAPGGKITLDCTVTQETIRIQVADTGIGIPADKLEAIFEPFVQVREGLAGRDAGVGLGLAISRDLAHGMHGTLTAESEVGQGSRFALTLPRAGVAGDQ